jgi:hypothetical protein
LNRKTRKPTLWLCRTFVESRYEHANPIIRARRRLEGIVNLWLSAWEPVFHYVEKEMGPEKYQQYYSGLRSLLRKNNWEER